MDNIKARVIMQPEVLRHWKTPMTPLGIEPLILRLSDVVAQPTETQRAFEYICNFDNPLFLLLHNFANLADKLSRI
jgi:hypothetical protein